MNAKVIDISTKIKPAKPRTEVFTVKELKKILKYAEKHNVETVNVACSNESGIGVSKSVSKIDGSDEFDVTDVTVW